MVVLETLYLTGIVDVMLELLLHCCPLYFSGAPDVEIAEFGRCVIFSCVSSEVVWCSSDSEPNFVHGCTENVY